MRRAPPLRRVLYGSSTPAPLGAGDIRDILRVSCRNNAADDITGVLFYADGNVMQVLEGPGASVERTYGRIRKDPRHRHVSTYLDRAVEGRLFAEWSMGLVRLDDLTEADRACAQELCRVGPPGPEAGVVAHLLRSFCDAVARTPRPSPPAPPASARPASAA